MPDAHARGSPARPSTATTTGSSGATARSTRSPGGRRRSTFRAGAAWSCRSPTSRSSGRLERAARERDAAEIRAEASRATGRRIVESLADREPRDGPQPPRRRATAAGHPLDQPAARPPSRSRPVTRRHVDHLDAAIADARTAIDELRELAAGIHPAVLTTARAGAGGHGAREALPDPGRRHGRGVPPIGRQRRVERVLRRRRGDHQCPEVREGVTDRRADRLDRHPAADGRRRRDRRRARRPRLPTEKDSDSSVFRIASRRSTASSRSTRRGESAPPSGPRSPSAPSRAVWGWPHGLRERAESEAGVVTVTVVIVDDDSEFRRVAARTPSSRRAYGCSRSRSTAPAGIDAVLQAPTGLGAARREPSRSRRSQRGSRAAEAVVPVERAPDLRR